MKVILAILIATAIALRLILRPRCWHCNAKHRLRRDLDAWRCVDLSDCEERFLVARDRRRI